MINVERSTEPHVLFGNAVRPLRLKQAHKKISHKISACSVVVSVGREIHGHVMPSRLLFYRSQIPIQPIERLFDHLTPRNVVT